MTRPRTLVVTVPEMIGEADLAPLREVSDVDYKEVASISERELATLCDGYDYLMLNYDVLPTVGNFKLTEGFYATSAVRSLKGVATDITGMDWSSPKGAASNGVLLLNIPHYSTESVAESVLAEILLHSRQRHSAYIDEIRGRAVEARKGINLLGRTAGVIGWGSIGSRVAELLKAIGMNVVIWNRTPRPGLQTVSLETLFDEADVICVCLKTVKEGDAPNTGIVSGDLLLRCHGTIVVNLANAALVDHDAMVEALRDGRVAGYSVERSAALINSPLAKEDGVHLPPSNAWFSDESLETLRSTWVGNVISAIQGNPQNIYRD
ncbi:MAG TPA: NAD(P)-dependent oxidoreductase [Thermoanaerobaculia bacterium]|jgi:phosphoglycerate dehydrogenase-like enzyme